MRSSMGLFVVSALLFVFGIGFVVVAAKTARTAPAESAPAAPAVAPIANVRQLMYGIVGPSSNAIFQSVQTTVSDKGTEEIQPRNDQEWALLGAQAASLGEAGRMLMTDGRPIDRGDWLKMSQAMIDASTETLKAVAAKSPEGILAAGEKVNESCDACHQRYRRE